MTHNLFFPEVSSIVLSDAIPIDTPYGRVIGDSSGWTSISTAKTETASSLLERTLNPLMFAGPSPEANRLE